MPPLTSAQQAFIDNLKLTNTDDRAIRVIVAAFNVRNARSIGLELRDLAEVVDSVAG